MLNLTQYNFLSCYFTTNKAKSLKSRERGELKLNRGKIIQVDWWWKSNVNESQFMDGQTTLSLVSLLRLKKVQKRLVLIFQNKTFVLTSILLLYCCLACVGRMRQWQWWWGAAGEDGTIGPLEAHLPPPPDCHTALVDTWTRVWTLNSNCDTCTDT